MFRRSLRKVGFIMNFRIFKPDFWQSVTLVEFGFLWSVLFAVWGPVPRYLGWLLAIIGLLSGKLRGNGRTGVLHPFLKAGLLFVLLWGLPSSFFRKPDLFTFLKGYSLALEFAFSLWLAARVFSKESLQRFWVVLSASVVLAIIQTLYAFFFENHFAGLFSNINTLGFYGVILLPLFLSRTFEKGSVISWLVSAGILFIICLSSSSSAWVAGAFSLLLLSIMGGAKYLFKMFFLFSLFAVIFAGVWGGLERINPELKQTFARYMDRELEQLLSFGNPSKFTTNRSFIWQGTANLIKKYPLSGWGWGAFNDPFAKINSSWWDVKKTRLRAQNVDDAHNMYLNLSVYGGIPTTFAVLVLFLFSAYRAYVFSRKKAGDQWFWIAVSVSILSILFYSLAGDVFSIRYKFACIFWYYMGFAGRSDVE